MSTESTERGATFREVFAVGEFRVLFGSFALLVAGDSIKMLALSVLVFAQTGSPGLSAAAYMAGWLPYIFGGLFLLSLADRLPARGLMIAGELVRVVVCLLLAYAGLPVWAMLALVLVTGLFSPVFGAARSALLPEVLPGDAFVLGRSLLGVTSASAQIAGLAVGGAFLAAAGPHTALAATAGLSAVAALILRLGLPHHTPRRTLLPEPVTLSGAASADPATSPAHLKPKGLAAAPGGRATSDGRAVPEEPAILGGRATPKGPAAPEGGGAPSRVGVASDDQAVSAARPEPEGPAAVPGERATHDGRTNPEASAAPGGGGASGVGAASAEHAASGVRPEPEGPAAVPGERAAPEEPATLGGLATPEGPAAVSEGRAASGGRVASERRVRFGGGSAGAVGETLRVNRMLVADPRVRGLLLASWVPTLWLAGAEAMIVPYLGGQGEAGVVLAAAAGGMAVGEFAVGRFAAPSLRERLSLPLAVLLGVPWLGFVAGPGAGWAAVLAAVAAAGLSYQLGLQRRFLEAVPEEVRGQAFGLLSAGLMTGQAAGAALVGVLGEVFSPQVAIVAAGAAGVAVAFALAGSLRPPRRVATPVG